MARPRPHGSGLDGLGSGHLEHHGPSRGRPVRGDPPDPHPEGGHGREGDGRLPAVLAGDLPPGLAVAPGGLEREGARRAGARERRRGLRVPAADRHPTGASAPARAGGHVALPAWQIGRMGGLQARHQPGARPGEPRVQRPRLAEPRARRQGGRRADSVPGRVPGGPPRAVDDDRPVARGARNRRRGAWYEGGWRESRRTGLPHDGAQGGESAPRHDRGTIPDRRGRCRCGDADPPKAGSASRCLGAGRAAANPGHPRAGGPRRELPPRGPPVVGPIPVERPADALNTAATVPQNLEGDRAANETLTAIRGVRVGHAHDLRRRTGTTVVLLDPPAIAFADARGGWPGTYDTAASDLGKTFIERHALLLTGGDVYGFDAVRGIRRFLLERKLASWSGGGEMPAIMGTNIYDLEFADADGLDYTDFGNEACVDASTRPVAQGNIGAGTGATLGPFFGKKGGTKGGRGSSAARVGSWTVGAIVVTNCVGNVYDPFKNRTIGGTLQKDGKGYREMADVAEEYLKRSKTRSGTTIGVVGTDAPLDHEQLARLVDPP